LTLLTCDFGSSLAFFCPRALLLKSFSLFVNISFLLVANVADLTRLPFSKEFRFLYNESTLFSNVDLKTMVVIDDFDKFDEEIEADDDDEFEASVKITEVISGGGSGGDGGGGGWGTRGDVIEISSSPN
jgi:hypothetical protein